MLVVTCALSVLVSASVAPQAFAQSGQRVCLYGVRVDSVQPSIAPNKPSFPIWVSTALKWPKGDSCPILNAKKLGWPIKASQPVGQITCEDVLAKINARTFAVDDVDGPTTMADPCPGMKTRVIEFRVRKSDRVAYWTSLADYKSYQ